MTNIDQDLTAEILNANALRASSLGLRFDRVALAVLRDLRVFVEATAPTGTTVLATVTAPIRMPARTVDAMKREISGLLAEIDPHEDLCRKVHGNAVRLRRVPAANPRFVGFVHNPGSPSMTLLDLAQQWLLQTPRPDRRKP